MITVSPLNDKTQKEFEMLFAAYYAELGCDDDVPHLLKEYILPDLLAGLIKIDMLQEGKVYAGFVIYQTDDIDNDWNFKEGWGDIREIYVAPARRRKGYGKFLLYTAEMKLKESGVSKTYALPASGTEDFFTACGYNKTEDYCLELDCAVYEKTDLNNCECKNGK
ncbi:MAG: GNAT family N-acetyltransferase [Clostridia bacterium]|nr:GNAT family N-acetyltransferase [Clostridia bacterium]